MASKANKIRITVDKPGRGQTIIELEHCPIKEDGICRLELTECKYGLTEIKIPFPVCPMSGGSIVVLKFKAIKG